MKKIALIASLLMALTCSTPSYTVTISNREWHGYTGLGVLGGAIAGTWIYKKYIAPDQVVKPNNEKFGKQEKTQKAHDKSNEIRAIAKTIGAAAVGAFVGGLAIRKMLWSYSPAGQLAQEQARISLEQAQALAQEQARIAQEQRQAAQERDRIIQEEAARVAQEQARIAQEQARFAQAQNNAAHALRLIRQAETDDHLADFIIGRQDGNTIELLTATYFRGYPLALAEEALHRSAEQKLRNAAPLLQRALNDANGDQQLIQSCHDGLQQIEQLLRVAENFILEIRMHPNYGTQVEQLARDRAAQQIVQAEERKARASEALLAATQQRAREERQEAQQREEAERQRTRQKIEAEERTARATKDLARATRERAQAERYSSYNNSPAVVVQAVAYNPQPVYAPHSHYQVHVHTPAPVYTQPTPKPAPVYNAPKPIHHPKPQPALSHQSVSHLLSSASGNNWKVPNAQPSVKAVPVRDAFKPGSSMANFFKKK